MGNIAKKRAKMPKEMHSFLDSRSLDRDHKRLAELLEPNMFVLDVGCGTGAITYGIAQTIPEGRVIGVDINETLLCEAMKKYHGCHNLTFENKDLYSLPYKDQFDLVTTARVLQWLEQPLNALAEFKRVTKDNGLVVVLDYNHEKIKWDPQPPSSMLKFYTAFLEWREDAGMNNRIADQLYGMFNSLEFKDIEVSPQLETTRKGDLDFCNRIDLWAQVAEARGVQMVEDG